MTRINCNILECMCRVRRVIVVFVRNAISESGFRCAVMEVELSEASGWKLLLFLDVFDQMLCSLCPESRGVNSR